MLKNPQDRRAKRTAMQIKETMFSFMPQKAIHEITVSEICKVCQINRATFYDHYRDVFDLVQDMEQDMLLALQELMEAVSPEEMEAEEVSRLFFSFLADHREKLNLLITSERSREFCIQLDGVLMPFFEKKIRQNYAVPEQMERQLRSAMEFVATGYYRFFAKALTESVRNTALEAALCARLGDACLGLLFERKGSVRDVSAE
jgi:AcrR family transcriptional regulator